MRFQSLMGSQGSIKLQQQFPRWRHDFQDEGVFPEPDGFPGQRRGFPGRGLPRPYIL
jgi:hypothetical protein